MSLDHRVAQFFSTRHKKRPWLDGFAVVSAQYAIVLALVSAWIFLNEILTEKSWADVGIALFFLLAINWAVTVVLEYLFGRVRPFHALHKKMLGRFFVPTPSFPSAHAAISFALATAMIQLTGWPGIFWALLAILISWGRVYVGVHYVSDVVAGGILGIALTCFLFPILL